MIARIRGYVVERGTDFLVVDVGGVGYLLNVPDRVAEAAVGGDEMVFHVSTQYREHDIQLYGFLSQRDKDAFEELITVNGVGSRLALSALSTFTPGELGNIIAHDNEAALRRIPGVGQRLAQRILVELRGRITPGVDLREVKPGVPLDDPTPLALARLGYKRTEIDRALAYLDEKGMVQASLEDRVRTALQYLAQARK